MHDQLEGRQGPDQDYRGPKAAEQESVAVVFFGSYKGCLLNDLVLDTNRTRIVRKSKKTPSFFDFFTPPVPPSETAIENGEMDDDELDELRYKLEQDYDVGEDLKERVSEQCASHTLKKNDLKSVFPIGYSSGHRLLHWKGT